MTHYECVALSSWAGTLPGLCHRQGTPPHTRVRAVTARAAPPEERRVHTRGRMRWQRQCGSFILEELLLEDELPEKHGVTGS